MAPSKPKDNIDVILAELSAISAKLCKLDPVPEKLKAIEHLATLAEENAALKGIVQRILRGVNNNLK
jgi:hypothetical protein